MKDSLLLFHAHVVVETLNLEIYKSVCRTIILHLLPKLLIFDVIVTVAVVVS